MKKKLFKLFVDHISKSSFLYKLISSLQVAHNPLQFVTAQTGAIALSEQAKQQVFISDQQKRIRNEVRKNMVQ